MSKRPCEPLKITAHLADGRLNSVDGIVMLDSILYHAWFVKHAPHVLQGQGTENWSGHIGLPLKQLSGNRYAASKAVYKCSCKCVESYNKRPDFFAADKCDYIDRRKGIVSDSVGAYRAYRNQCIVRTVEDGILTFYAVGHKDGVEELLNLMPALGKKNAMGYGFVDKWDVEEIDKDYTTFHPEHGLMRPLPVQESETKLDYPIMEYAVKPPYYKPENAMICYVPIERGIV